MDSDSEQSNMDLTYWDPELDVWDPDHKKSVLEILKREMRDKYGLCGLEVHQIIIKGVEKAKSMDEYIKIPARLTKVPLFR